MCSTLRLFNRNRFFNFNRLLLVSFVLIITSLLCACQVRTEQPRPTPTDSATVTPIPTATATQTFTPTLRPTLIDTSTPVPSPTATPTQTFTPEPLSTFSSTVLREGIFPQTYITDTCTYLRMRWAPDGSPPGTTVAVIMFHSILKPGRVVSDSVSITEQQFINFVDYASSLGFKTITTDQLNAFLRTNARIPPRSMMMILDDRRPGTVESYFLPVLERHNWTVTLGWNIEDTDAALWKRLEDQFATGRVDIQSHGFWHRYIVETTPEEEIRQEIFGPIPVMQEHIGQRPYGFIWPGGNFTPLSVQLVQEAGYELGFSSFARGPLQFNWIPLGEQERAVNAPLYVLPRFWDTALGVNLDISVKAAQQARDFAKKNYEQEARIYKNSCGGVLPRLEDILP